MNIQQLRSICAVARNNLSISKAAQVLHTSQPGVSKQIQLLEKELGVAIFVRNRNRLTEITGSGRAVIDSAQRVLLELKYIRNVGKENLEYGGSAFVVAASHIQATYVLPEVMRKFGKKYPRVPLIIKHAHRNQAGEILQAGEADLCVTSDIIESRNDLLTLPCRQLTRIVLTQPGHPLLKKRRKITLIDVARYPIVTYEATAIGGRVQQAFEKNDLVPNVMFQAVDADAIKACIGQGLGIAVLPEIVFDPKRDSHLRAIDASHLFEPSVASVSIHRKSYLQRYVFDFIEMFAPQWTEQMVRRALG